MQRHRIWLIFSALALSFHYLCCIGYTSNGGSTDETLPWCSNNAHKDGEWVPYTQPQSKSFVCCGGGYNSIYSAQSVWANKSWDHTAVPGYCNPVNTLPSFLERGYAQWGAQCGDDCCICDREDNTRFVPNAREKYFWKPRGCRLLDWNSTLFCNLLGTRKIAMIGDSSMQQTASTLMSMITGGNGECAGQLVFGRSDHVIFGFKGHHHNQPKPSHTLTLTNPKLTSKDIHNATNHNLEPISADLNRSSQLCEFRGSRKSQHHRHHSRGTRR